jgi:hypothetical protein
MVGEVFVGGAGMAGLKMTQGALRVEEIAGSKRVMLASLEPVFLPKRPAASGPFFTSDPPVTPSPGAKGAFAPSGQSIGYLEADGQLVIEPGFTANLTRPFPPRLIRLAMASIPENDLANAAMPLFDVNGAYVGYLVGPVFYAQAAQAAPPAAEGEESAWPSWVGAAVGVAAVGVGISAGAGAFSGGGPGCRPATPVGPGSVCP